MKRGFIMVHSALNPVEAQVVRFLFENNGIEAIIDNDRINFFFGIVSAKDAMVEVWVPENKYKDAARLLLEKSSLDPAKYEMTSCPKCGEKVCSLFDYCWNCLTNLKSGEAFKSERAITGAEDAEPKKHPLSLYILILLIALIVAVYLTYFYFRPF
jgi:hypothetical protein